MTASARPVAPAADIGSPDLATALAAADPAGISSALRSGWVVLPLLRTGRGREIRLIEGLDGRTGWELPVFSSVATLHSFLADDDQRDFDFVPGSALPALLRDAGERIARIVFDPAEPHATAAATTEILDAVGETAVTPAPARGIRETDRVVDLDLPLGDDWFRIDLTAVADRDRQIRALADRQLAGLRAGATLRVQLAQWLRRMAVTAAGGGGRETAFLLRRTADAALALSVTRYWHRLSTTPAPHLDTIEQRLRSQAEPGDLDAAMLETGRLLRQTRTLHSDGTAQPGSMPVLAVDYWLEFPDRRGLCLVGFSTPHLDQREAVLAVTDEIVVASTWVVAARDEEEDA